MTSAADGKKGFERRAGSFDLIILDVMLPKKNGYDIARDLRQKGISDADPDADRERRDDRQGSWA